MGKNNNQSKIRILQGEQRLGAAARSSAFLAVEDFTAGSEPILTIREIGFGECVLDGGRREDHDVIFFKEASVPGLPQVRPMLVNSTNRKTLLAVYGDLSADVLTGKRIRLYVDPRVKAVGGGTTQGIRIRKLVPEPVQPSQQTVRSNPVQPEPVQSVQTSQQPVCSDCGSPITAAGDCSAEQVLQNGRQWFGLDLCAACQTRRINANQNNQ